MAALTGDTVTNGDISPAVTGGPFGGFAGDSGDSPPIGASPCVTARALGLIPGCHADIEWNDQWQNEAIGNLRVFDRRRERADQRFMSAMGACCLGWMDGSDPRLTPEGVWISICDNFESNDAKLKALAEFGRIEECGWARTMAAAAASMGVDLSDLDA